MLDMHTDNVAGAGRRQTTESGVGSDSRSANSLLVLRAFGLFLENVCLLTLIIYLLINLVLQCIRHVEYV